MHIKITSDERKARRHFEKFVRPTLSRYFETDNIFSLESRRNEFENALDRFCGVDGIIFTGEAIPFACRIQSDGFYESFSIRRSRPSGAMTEFEKLRCSIADKSAVKPLFSIQAFVHERNKAAIVAIAPTAKIIAAIEENPKWRGTKTGETFFYTPWRDVPNCEVFLVNPDSRIDDVTYKYSA